MAFSVSLERLTAQNPGLDRALLTDFYAEISEILPSLGAIDELPLHVQPYLDKPEQSPFATLDVKVASSHIDEDDDPETATKLDLHFRTNSQAEDTPGGIATSDIEREHGEITLWGDGELFIDHPIGVSEKTFFASAVDELPKFTAAIRAARNRRTEARKAAEENSDVPLFGPLEKLDLPLDANSLLTSTPQEKIAPMLHRAGLSPQTKQTIGNATTVYFSPIFSDKPEGGRNHVIAYVEGPGGVEAQVMYTSMSSSRWRWLPAYDVKDGYYAKGEHEDMMTLPVQLQASLYAIEADGVLVKPESELGELIATASLVPHFDRSEPIATMPLAAMVFNKVPVEEPTIDFSNRILSAKRENDPVYGILYTDTYLSPDGQFAYTFAHNAEGLAYLMDAQKQGSTIRRNGLVAGDFVELAPWLRKPAYEYASQMMPKFGAPSKHAVHGHYVNNFHNILDLPVIQAYYRTIPREHMNFMQEVPADILPSVTVYSAHEALQERNNVIPSLTQPQIKDAMYRIAADSEDDQLGQNSAFARAQSILEKLDNLKPGGETAVSTTIAAPMEPLQEGTKEHGDFVTGLTGLGFSRKHTIPEKHDPAVQYEYWSSPLFADKQIVISVANGKIVDVSALLMQ